MANTEETTVYTLITKNGKSKVELGDFELASKPVLNGIIKVKGDKGVILYRAKEINSKETAVETIRTILVETLVEEGAVVIDGVKTAAAA